MASPKFLLVGDVRTGGTVICETLNKHPALKVLTELFDNNPDETVLKIRQDIFYNLYNFVTPRPHLKNTLDQTLNFIPLINKVYEGFNGFKLHRESHVSYNNPTWAYLAARTDIKIIHLYRKNLLLQIISEKLAQQSGVWHLQNKEKRPEWRKIYFEPVFLNSIFNQRASLVEYYKYMFAQSENLVISYEEIEQNIKSVIKVCLDFLGMPQADLEIPFRKLTTAKPKDILYNYSELVEYF